MIRVAIVTGSTRPSRKSEAVADWVYSHANKRHDAEYVVVDIAKYKLPLFDESIPPRMARYQNDHTKAWAAEIDRYDAFVFVTPEYNHSLSAALKNAIDYLFREWHHKAAGFVSYGADKGVRAVEHLRQILGELAVADVRAKVALSLRSDCENFSEFKPRDHHVPLLNAMLDEVKVWGEAMKLVRETHCFNLMGQPIEKVRTAPRAEIEPGRRSAGAIASPAQIADRWTAAFAAGDVDALVALYHPAAVLESPVVYALESAFEGSIRGVDEIKAFFNAVVRSVPPPPSSRRPSPLTDGDLFVWESKTSTEGARGRDFVEVMQMSDGLIYQHRFYWGWRAILHLLNKTSKDSS